MLNYTVLSITNQDVTGTFSDVLIVQSPYSDVTFPISDVLTVSETMDTTDKLGRLLDIINSADGYTDGNVPSGISNRSIDVMQIAETFSVVVGGDWAITPDVITPVENYLGYVDLDARRYTPMQ